MDSSDLTESFLENIDLDHCPNWTDFQRDVGAKSTWWMEGILQLLLTILGLLTTSLSIFILSRKILSRHTFNQLLIALATFDSIYLLFMMLESIGRCFPSELWHWLHGLLTPYILYPVKAIAMSGSIYIMTAVAIERYIAVYHPFSRIPSHFQSPSEHRRSLHVRLTVYLTVVILFSILINISLFFESKTIPEAPYIQVTSLRTNHNYITAKAWVRFLLLGILPTVSVSILNYKIYLAIRNSSSGRFCQGDDSLSIVLFFIVVIFLICNIPRIIILMYDTSVDNRQMNECSQMELHSYPFWNVMLGLFSHILLVLNPFLNFLVYCFIGKTFRSLAAHHFGWISPWCSQAPIPPLSTSSRKNTISTKC